MVVEVVVIRNKGQKYYSLARSPLRLPGSADSLARSPLRLPGRLLALKQLRKNQPPGGKHHASEGRASAKTTPKNCLTCRLKS